MSVTWHGRRPLSAYQDTSRAALASVRDRLSDVDARIVAAITNVDGLTCGEVESVTGMQHQTVSAQIRHLVEAGVLEDSGEKRKNANNRQCIVWRAATPTATPDRERWPVLEPETRPGCLF